MSGIRINDQLTLPEGDLHWSFARSSGPGGQNVNKVNSKAVLRWKPHESQLPQAARMRLEQVGKRYWTKEGEIVIQAQEHRDQHKNVQACRRRLASLVRSALKKPKRRIQTEPTKASKRRRLENKRRQGQKKRLRQSRGELY